MNCYLNIFNNREKAIAIWLIIFFLWTLFQKDFRDSFIEVLKALFQTKVLTIIGSMLLYASLTVSILSKIGVWNAGLIKDTIFWTLGTAFVLLLNTNKATQKEKHFKEILLDNLKLILILEFIVNLCTFNFWIELILMPLLCIIGAIGAVAENKKEFMSVKKASDFILSAFGVFIMIFAFFKTVGNYHEVATLGNLRALILPPLLTFVYIPFLYFWALVMSYELLFVRLDRFLRKDKKLAKYAKQKILASCHINLSMLNKLSTEGAPELVRLRNETDLINLIKKFKKT